MRADRLVRSTDEFFERLDEMLPAQRSVVGVRSATDFIVFEGRVPMLRR